MNVSRLSGAQLVNSIMETFDLDKDGFLNFDEFCDLMHNAGLELTLWGSWCSIANCFCFKVQGVAKHVEFINPSARFSAWLLSFLYD